jgi:hypothetical protein
LRREHHGIPTHRGGGDHLRPHADDDLVWAEVAIAVRGEKQECFGRRVS